MSEDLGSIYSSINLRLDKFESSVTKALQGFYKLQTGTEKVSSIMDKSVYTAVSNIDKSYKLWESTSGRTAKSIESNTKYVESLKDKINILDSEIKKADKTLEDMTKQCGENSKEVQEYSSHVLDLKLSHAELSKELVTSQKELTSFSGKMKMVGDDFKKIDEKFSGLENAGNKLKNIGDTATMKFTLPIVGAATAATKFAMDFEKGVAKVGTIADTTKMSMDNLKKGVVSLSNDTGVSTGELNDALYETISAGIDTAKSVDFLDTAVKAAKGGFTDTATAVDGLSTVLNSYGLTADEVNKIANQMLITQNLGKTTFGELASAVGKVTPIAAALGIKTEELFSSLASTTAQGLATAESVTALKAAMSNIIKPTKEASDAAEVLGIEFSASALKSKGWMGFLNDIREKLKEAAPAYDDALMRQEKYTRLLAEAEKAGSKNNDQIKEYKKRLKDAKDEVETLTQAQDSQIGAFATMFGSVEGLNSILMLTSESGMKLYNQSMEQMKTNTTALDDAYNKMSDTTEEKFNKALNKSKNTAMEFGVKFLPVVEKGINLLSDMMDRFNKLSPSTQDFIAKSLLATAALGPFLKVTGGTVSTINGMVKLAPKVSAFFGVFKGASAAAGAAEAVGTAATVASGAATGGGILGLGASLGGLTLAAAPWLIGGAAVAGTGYLIYKGMTKEAIPAVDLFADKVNSTATNVNASTKAMAKTIQSETIKISESTKNAVSAYIKMDDDVTKVLTNLYANSTKLTDENSIVMVSKFTEMGNQIKIGMDQKYNDIYNSMKLFYDNSSVLSTDEENKSLEKLKTDNESKKTVIDGYLKQIGEIQRQASQEHRGLTTQEQQTIDSIREKMRETAVKTLSQTEVESKVILERLKNYSTRITAEQAAEVVKNANKTRDDSVKAADEQYNKTLADIIKLRDESKIITSDQADKLIADATRQRDESIKKAEEMRTGVIDKLRQMTPDIENEVNIATGKIMTAWDKLLKWWDNLWFSKKTFNLDAYSTAANYSGQSYADMKSNIGHNASGAKSWRGGLTTINEEGYEVYDLPKGTRIYNHDASEDLVMKTAAQVAKSVLGQVNVQGTGVKTVIIPVNLDGREIARITAPFMNESLNDEIRFRNQSYGGDAYGTK